MLALQRWKADMDANFFGLQSSTTAPHVYSYNAEIRESQEKVDFYVDTWKGINQQLKVFRKGLSETLGVFWKMKNKRS